MIATFSLAGCKKEAAEEEVVEEATPVEEAAEEEVVEEEAAPAEEVELSILMKSGVEKRGDRWIDVFNELNPNSNIKINIEYLGYDQLHDKIAINESSGTGAYDVYYYITDWLPEFLSGEFMIPLNSYLESDPLEGWPDAFPIGVTERQTIDGNVYGIPAHDGPQMFFYRTDLFNDETEKDNFLNEYGYELTPPKDFKQYKDVADFFTRPEENLYGTALAGNDPQSTAYDFISIAHNMGGAYWDEKGNPVFNSEQWVEALELVGSLFKENSPPGSEQNDMYGRTLLFAEGIVACYPEWMGMGSVFADKELSNIIGNFDAELWPGDVVRENMSSYWIWSISPTTSPEKQDAGYEFIKTVESEEGELLAMLGPENTWLVGSRKSTIDNPEVLERYPQYNIMGKILDGNVFYLPYHVSTALILDELKIAVQRYMAGEGSAQQILDDANARIVKAFK